MTLLAAVGQAQALDGREAGLQAAHQALNRLGSSSPFFSIVLASHQYDAKLVVNGVSSLLGNLPLVGFSTPAGLTKEGQYPHSVVVALLSSSDAQAEAHWFSGYAQSGRETAAKLMQIAAEAKTDQTLLFFADGYNGDAEQLCSAFTGDHLPLVGSLASGDMHTGHNYQIAGSQTGSGGLAAVFLRGNIRIGVGFNHGWDPVGSQFRVTRSRGFWLRTLDGRPASEAYAQLFGHPARDWAFPPLNHLVRLYPLGIERGDELIVRSPLRIEADGSFRMNATVRDGLDAYLLVGSRSTCQKAAQQAAQQALAGLGEARPAFVLILADIAWQMLLKAQPGTEVAAVQEIFGDEVPIAGGYTLGQIISKDTAAPPQFLNQHILVVAFGETTQG